MGKKIIVFCVFSNYMDRELGEHQQLEGIYSSQKKAEDFVQKNPDYYIEEWFLDVE